MRAVACSQWLGIKFSCWSISNIRRLLWLVEAGASLDWLTRNLLFQSVCLSQLTGTAIRGILPLDLLPVLAA